MDWGVDRRGGGFGIMGGDGVGYVVARGAGGVVC